MHASIHHLQRGVNLKTFHGPNHTCQQRLLVIVKGRHDRHTNKSERRSQPRQLFENPYQQPAQNRKRERRDLDENEEELGWWQQPQRSNAEPEQEELEEWQIERLEEAYAIGRRKVSVSKLSDELDLDRSFILSWFKEFGQRPAQEVQAIVMRHKQRLLQQQGAMSGPVGDPLSQRTAAQEQEASALGYVPFYVRQEMGLSRRKLSSETLRTLESLYTRTPYPSNEVIKGLYDMFKLPRDIAIEWFEKRRQLDAERQQQQAVAAGAAGAAGKAAGARKDMWSFEHKGKQAAAAAQRGPAAGPRSSELSELLGDAELPEGVEAAGQQQQRKEGVYKLTPKELAMVRSSLPSPRKSKGLRLAEELNIKTATKVQQAASSSAPKVQEQIEIAGIKYATSDGQQLWRQRWRRRRAREGIPGKALDWGSWYMAAVPEQQ